MNRNPNRLKRDLEAKHALQCKKLVLRTLLTRNTVSFCLLLTCREITQAHLARNSFPEGGRQANLLQPACQPLEDIQGQEESVCWLPEGSVPPQQKHQLSRLWKRLTMRPFLGAAAALEHHNPYQQ